MFKRNEVFRIWLPFLGSIALARDPGHAKFHSGTMFLSDLQLKHFSPEGELIETRETGSGLVTVVGVNQLVSDAVSAIASDTLANFKYMDSGTGATAATDGDTGLQTVITATAPARVVSTLSNGQTATTGNHTAKLQYVGTVTYNTSGPTYPIAITEWVLMDATSAGHCFDHKVFSAVNVSSGDSIQYTYLLSLPSNN